jgi:hypothetical protein
MSMGWQWQSTSPPQCLSPRADIDGLKRLHPTQHTPLACPPHARPMGDSHSVARDARRLPRVTRSTAARSLAARMRAAQQADACGQTVSAHDATRIPNSKPKLTVWGPGESSSLANWHKQARPSGPPVLTSEQRPSVPVLAMAHVHVQANPTLTVRTFRPTSFVCFRKQCRAPTPCDTIFVTVR